MLKRTLMHALFFIAVNLQNNKYEPFFWFCRASWGIKVIVINHLGTMNAYTKSPSDKTPVRQPDISENGRLLGQ